MSRDITSYLREMVANLGQRIHRLETLEQESVTLYKVIPSVSNELINTYVAISGMSQDLTSGLWMIQIIVVIEAINADDEGKNVSFRIIEDGSYVAGSPIGRLTVPAMGTFATAAQFWTITVPADTTRYIEVEIIKDSGTGIVNVIGYPDGDTQMIIYRLSTGTV